MKAPLEKEIKITYNSGLWESQKGEVQSTDDLIDMWKILLCY